MYNNTIWIFLSHSNKDYEKVCKIRDKLEKKNFRPIMFFLKCIEEHHEIDDLIKREIDARSKFILCNSIHARESKWVQNEIEYIKSKNRMYDIIDLDISDYEIEKKINQFIFRVNVFISYSINDEKFVKSLENELMKNEYNVLNQNFFTSNDGFAVSMSNAIKKASSLGYILYVASKNSVNSKLVYKELEVARSQGGKIIVVFLSLDNDINRMLEFIGLDGVVKIYQNNEDDITFSKKVVELLVKFDNENFMKF